MYLVFKEVPLIISKKNRFQIDIEKEKIYAHSNHYYCGAMM